MNVMKNYQYRNCICINSVHGGPITFLLPYSAFNRPLIELLHHRPMILRNAILRSRLLCVRSLSSTIEAVAVPAAGLSGDAANDSGVPSNPIGRAYHDLLHRSRGVSLYRAPFDC
jgi:hypothetical protein